MPSEKTVTKYQTSAPELANWMETALPEGFTIFELPKEVRKRLRTSNMLENLNKQIRRRTRVVSIFHNSASCLRLIAAVLMEQSDDWESGRAYLNPKSIVRLAMEQDIQAKKFEIKLLPEAMP